MLQAIERYLQKIRGERRTLRRNDQLRLYCKAVEAWRAKYAKMPRWGHKDINNSSDDAPQGIEVLRDPAANNKATGSEAVPNELLKFLPECMHTAIHQMFVSMWITGDTPTAWKCSHTVMCFYMV